MQKAASSQCSTEVYLILFRRGEYHHQLKLSAAAFLQRYNLSPLIQVVYAACLAGSGIIVYYEPCQDAVLMCRRGVSSQESGCQCRDANLFPYHSRYRLRDTWRVACSVAIYTGTEHGHKDCGVQYYLRESHLRMCISRIIWLDS